MNSSQFARQYYNLTDTITVYANI